MQTAGERNPPEKIRILMVEDVALDAELEVHELKRAGLRVASRVVDTEAAFRGALREFAPNLVISDFSMPHFDGMAALAMARELAPDIPFIFVSGAIGEEYAIRALKNGATDYVLKTNLMRLPAAVERALQEARDRQARCEAECNLAATRERLQSISESLPDVLWSHELPSMRTAHVSAAAAQIYGRPAEEFLAKSDLRQDMIHPDDRPGVDTAWRELLKGEPFDVEYRILRPDGEQRWINDRGRLIRDAAGNAVRVDGLARDITDAVRQRERLARLDRIRDLLGAANAAFMRIRERNLLFEEFCRIAVSRGGFLLARVVELDRSGKASVVATTDNAPDVFASVVDEYNRDPEHAQSLLAHALRSGQATVSNDMQGDDRAPARAKRTARGNYSLAILPVRVAEEVVAAALLHAREPGFFDQEELALLAEMVANLEFALQLQAKQERLDYLALYDAGTGLPNRTLFRDRLTQALEGERRGRSKLALMLFDIERFKAVNDTFGPHVGDRLLQQIAAELRSAVGDLNRVAHLGGDVFALMLPALHDAAAAATVLREQATRILDRPFAVAGRELRMTVKAGIALFPEDGDDADTLFRNAEAALKRAKVTGERYLFYAPQINARVAERMELEHALRAAIEKGEFLLHYQPKVDLEKRQIVGVEVLLRWNRPGGGLVAPGALIPVLEATGMILELGQRVMIEAAATYRDWRERGLRAPRIAVNVSAIQLRQPDFTDSVRAAIGAGSGPCGLDLEVTESLLMENMEQAIRKLRQVGELGVGVSLDDFGTGYSSLAHLARLPVDTLKIDRAFIKGMTDNPDDTSIVTTIISLGRSLKRKVIAEGVETEEQARLLRLLRCDQMQGYLFSPPVPRDRIEALIAAGAQGVGSSPRIESAR